MIEQRRDRTYVFPDHYVAVMQFVCAKVRSELCDHAVHGRINVQLARIERMVFSSVLVRGTVLFI